VRPKTSVALLFGGGCRLYALTRPIKHVPGHGFCGMWLVCHSSALFAVFVLLGVCNSFGLASVLGFVSASCRLEGRLTGLCGCRLSFTDFVTLIKLARTSIPMPNCR